MYIIPLMLFKRRDTLLQMLDVVRQNAVYPPIQPPEGGRNVPIRSKQENVAEVHLRRAGALPRPPKAPLRPVQ